MKLVGKMATYPDRIDIIEHSIKSIISQLDILVVCFNQFEKIPNWVNKHSNLKAIIPERDLKDTGKFIDTDIQCDYIFYLDDDIIYPENYVEHTMKEFEKIDNENVALGYHGSWYESPRLEMSLLGIKKWLGFKLKISNPMWYRNCAHFLQVWPKSNKVDQLGTGVMAIPAKSAPPFEFIDGSQKFVDVRFARWCFLNKINMLCLKHKECWLQALTDDGDNTIFSTFTAQTPPYVQKEIYSYAAKSK
ncbi:glycosyltransferase family A protein [Thalassotalea euphylliae]|uniref:Glycosyltransferase family 2 protein n=1 Tax=Thalassotalea euphylliae TaxID=1655234 RepID=A0A3E0U589_9GAMM|nr:glycosyltransferase family A protein [Thalassotalea euphylliae]REL31132.1 glycosyltransferase family 2 protein [Thalassotalea euphylliae]